MDHHDPTRAGAAQVVREEFDDRGYVVAPTLLSSAEVECYRDELRRLTGLGDEDFGRDGFR